MYSCICKIVVILMLLCIFMCSLYKYRIMKSNNRKIPRIIHQIMLDKNDINPLFQKNIESLQRINSGWKYVLYDDNDIEEFIKKNYPNHIYETYKSINPEYGAAKADYFRYLVMYKVGGVYFDIKSGSKEKLDSIIKDNDEYLIIEHPEWNEYAQWVLITKPGHPLMKDIIDAITDKINNYNEEEDGTGKLGVLHLTGPKIYSKIIDENKHKYSNLSYHDNYRNLHLNYCNIDAEMDTHINLFNKPHYSTLTTPIVMREK